MALFRLINESNSSRHIWSRGRQVLVVPGEVKNLDMEDGNAIFIRRCEKRGDKLQIEAIGPEGKEILLQADNPIIKQKFNMVGRINKSEEFKDEIQEEKMRKAVEQEMVKMKAAAAAVAESTVLIESVEEDPSLDIAVVQDHQNEQPSRPQRVSRKKA